MPNLHFAESLSRLGTESAFVVLARAQALAAQGRDIINLGIGQPDFKTPEHIVEAGIKALRDGHHGYTPANGIPALREAVAADLNRRHGVEVNPDNVVVVPGGKPTMFFAVLMFGEPGAEVMYPNPGFPIYESVIRYSGATPVPIALREENGFAFSAEEVLGQITDATRLIIINSPANPTGGVTPRAEIDKLVEGLAAHPQVALMSDEIYSNMLYDGREHVSLLQYPDIRDRLIMLDGWSKTYAMTGWRLGYAVWPDACVDHVTRLCINDHSCVNAATQYAGIAALNGPQDAVRQMVAQFDARRAAIVRELNALPGVRCADAAGAFYAFPNIEGTGMRAKEAQDRFLDEAGVATVAGTSFGAWGEGYLRFSYANSTENILEALSRIRKLL
ncbi:aspartate aminotransferase [Rhodovulum iodosum]|uniref:aspartate transaminase n=1 Tax=Rhodovulum iodosum TaxID=68291 RepID=A0ABV3XZ28_9RHOB|nr:pyridoxal phosphate-dependent aminotransferase [Rhodovulum robiginosum]RSK36474.1 pyridoxal phosphate-dependent aminotransferase [Rhodovulum robiginosum]